MINIVLVAVADPRQGGKGRKAVSQITEAASAGGGGTPTSKVPVASIRRMAAPTKPGEWWQALSQRAGNRVNSQGRAEGEFTCRKLRRYGCTSPTQARSD